ncbi:MAG TPA: amidohydrolase family protein [Candidatus Hydrogenedentes bacterium]|nr:amidohydrolase family protein [Candidatus Hydrogenedentota bacterium]
MTTGDRFVEKALEGEPIDQCTVIDIHGHIGPEAPDFPIADPGLEAMIASMDRMGIDLACVSGLPGLFGDAARGNRLVQNALERYPDRFWGYITVDIGYPKRIYPELERRLEVGFRGIKIWSTGLRPGLPYDHPNYEGVFDFANVHRLPVLAHTWGDELDQLEPAIQRSTNVHWLLAHAGAQQVEKYVRFARTYPNVFLELAWSKCPRGLVEYFVDEGLADNVVWGSDATFLDAAQQLGRVLFAKISPRDKQKILGENAHRALRLQT